MAKTINMTALQAALEQGGTVVTSSELTKVNYSYARGVEFSVDVPNNAKGFVEFALYDNTGTLLLANKEKLKDLAEGKNIGIVDGAAFQGPGVQPASGGYSWGLSTEPGGTLVIEIAGDVAGVAIRCKGGTSTDFDQTTCYLVMLNKNNNYSISIPFTFEEIAPPPEE